MRLTIGSKNISNGIFLVLISIIWTQGTLFVYFKSVMRRLPVFGTIFDSVLLPCGIICLIILAVPFILENTKKSDIFFYASILFIYCISYLLNINNRTFLGENAVSILLNTVPVYFIGLSINEEKIIDLFYKLSLVSIVCMFLYNNTFGLLEQNEYMSEAYRILPHISLVSYYLIKKPRALNVTTSLIGIIMLISYGNRGTVLIFAIYITVCLFFFKNYKHRILIMSLLVFGIILLVIFSDAIVLRVAEVIEDMGMSTRVIDKFLQGDFFTSDSRDNLKSIIWDGILKNPILGYGIGGDRCLVPLYAHNILYEMWASFGLIFGTSLIICIICLIFRAIKRIYCEEIKIFIWLLVCCAFIKLFISSTYLNEPLFFLLFGFCVAINRRIACTSEEIDNDIYYL